MSEQATDPLAKERQPGPVPCPCGRGSADHHHDEADGEVCRYCAHELDHPQATDHDELRSTSLRERVAKRMWGAMEEKAETYKPWSSAPPEVKRMKLIEAQAALDLLAPHIAGEGVRALAVLREEARFRNRSCPTSDHVMCGMDDIYCEPCGEWLDRIEGRKREIVDAALAPEHGESESDPSETGGKR